MRPWGGSGCCPGRRAKGTTRGQAQVLPHLGSWLRLPASSGMELSDFSIPCLFININCNYIISWYASHFHSASDLHLIRKVTMAGPQSLHLCSHTALCWQLQEDTPRLSPLAAQRRAAAGGLGFICITVCTSRLLSTVLRSCYLCERARAT